MDKYFSYTDGDLDFHYLKDTKPVKANFNLHTHEFCEFYCFLGGKGEYKVEGNTYPLQVGDILLMQPGEAHYISIDPSHPYKRLAILFNPALFDWVDSSRKLLRPFLGRDRGEFNYYSASAFQNENHKFFINNICNPTGDIRTSIIANFLPLLNELASAFDNKTELPTQDPLINKIIDYINSDISKKISLDDICKMFFISKPHLCRIFKTATGSTVWEYVTAKRLINAKTLMRSGKSPTEVYAECGFGDYSSFYRAFKKRFGVSPDEFNNK